ncbi:MAG: ATP-binding protein, partial [Phycisphaerales bacterium]|nr:ATP-binding protein [Phycisphaerales bacterium]
MDQTSLHYVLFVTILVAGLVVGHIWMRNRADLAGQRRGLPWTVWAIVCAMGIAGILASDQRTHYERQRIAGFLSGLAPTYAREMLEAGLEHITLDTPPDDPTYLHLIELQKRWQEINPTIADIYTFILDDQKRTRLLVDSETDYDRNGQYEGEREARTAIGEIYDEAWPLLVNTFNGGRGGFEEEPVTDRWGTWVSSCYPIKNEQGKLIGVLGVDFPASQFVAAQQGATLFVLGVTASLALLTIAVAAIARSGAAALARERELGEARRQTAEAALAGSRAKSAFMAHMSHEIRTPVAAIVGYADLLGSTAVSPSEQQEHLGTIARNGQHLLTVINDILDLSAIDAGKLTVHPEPIDPIALVSEVGALLDVRCRAKDLELLYDLRWPIPATIDADPVRLRQILVNLVGNAVKFTPSGSVTISLGADLIGRVLISITDTGVGIRPDQVGQLFQPFVQGDAGMDRRFGGTGLGLTISRRLAQAMGGDITVTSTLGVGSTFTVVLPIRPGTPLLQAADLTRPLDADIPRPALPHTSHQLDRAIAETSAASSSPATPSSVPQPEATSNAAHDTAAGPRVVLAEDGVDNRRLLTFHLKRLGAQVHIACDGREAVKVITDLHAAGTPADIVLMDMQMPELDGYAATQHLRT